MSGIVFLLGFTALAFIATCVPFLVDHRFFLTSNLHDALFIADIGYRFAAGQVPHLGFYSPLGVGFAAIMALGARPAATMLETLRNASILFGIGIIPLLIYTCRTRLSSVGAAALIAVCLFLAIVPHNLGDPATATAYHSMYNRMAYVLLLLVVVIAMARPARPLHAGIDRFVTSALAIMLLYMKVNYGVLAFAFVFAAAVIDRDYRPIVVAVGLFAAMAVALELLLGAGFNAAYLSDLVILAKAAQPPPLRRIADAVIGCVPDAVLMLAALVAAGAPRRWPGWRMALLGGLAGGIGLLLLVQNTAQAWGLVLGLGPVIALLGVPATRAGVAGTIVLVVYSLLYIVPPAISEVSEIGRVRAAPASTPGIPALADLAIMPTAWFALPDGGSPLEPGAMRSLQKRFGTGQPPIDAYVATLQSGLDLLTACPAGAGVVTLDFTDAFAMLRRSPPVGGAAWLHHGLDFTERSHPAPERLFGGVACVMVPELPIFLPTFDGIMATYGPFLTKHYMPRAHNLFWTLYVPAER